MNEEEYLTYINNLEEEIKRLRKENKNTIKLIVNYNDKYYTIDTQIKDERIEHKTYYLADDYQEPTPVTFLGYIIDNTLGADLIIVCSCMNKNTNKIEEYFQKSLFKTKKEAGDEYLKRKYSK